MKNLCPVLLFIMFSAIPLAGQDSGTYTHTGLDGIILAKSDTWYYEEFDTAGRPVEGVRWEKNEIVEKTTWSYFDDTQRIRQSVTTTDELITETRYDRNGNVIEIRETIVPPEEDDEEAKPAAAESREKTEQKDRERVITYSYDERNLLRETLTRQGTVLIKTRFDYQDDGSLSEKTVFKNGELTIRYVYRDEENWTETVYHDDLVVLTVVYQNGERTRIQYETW
ncbi:MAG TPA: hypothetical protein PLS27_00940 [Treponemataceae bacterium]|nr:hypothetical protein [Treponemataceae bacterium]HPX12903.1 hypothetical protein [Treponemataceae bacterium]HQF73791.1 hypothetical protein [Treponemataceae bacterium]HRR02085.1 hypothetical protein [Treponemataceae bacterium]